MSQIIDIHTHMIPPGIVELAESASGYQGHYLRDGHMHDPRGFSYEVPPEFYSVEAKVESLDRLGLDAAVVSVAPTLFMYELEPQRALAHVRQVNDELAALAATGNRIFALGNLPMHQPAEAAEELIRVADDLGLQGVIVGTRGSDSMPLDHPEFEPLLAAAAARSFPLLLHPHDGERWPKLDDFYLDNVIGNPLSTTVAVMRLICAGTLERHRGLRIVLAHGGGFLPYQVGRLRRALTVREETAAKFNGDLESILRRLFVDTVTHSEQALAFAADQLGEDNILIGSDLPFDMADEDPVGRVLRAGLDPAPLGGNAERIFGIHAKKGQR